MDWAILATSFGLAFTNVALMARWPRYRRSAWPIIVGTGTYISAVIVTLLLQTKGVEGLTLTDFTIMTFVFLCGALAAKIVVPVVPGPDFMHHRQ